MKQAKQCMHQRNIEASSRNQCCLGKAMSVTSCMCFYIQLSTKQSPCGVFYCHLLSIPALQNFSTLFKKRYDFRKKLLNIKCVLIFSIILSEKFLILRRIERNIIINLKTSSCEVLFVLVRF